MYRASGICRIEVPTLSVIAVQQKNCGLSTVDNEIVVDGILANVGSGIVF